MLNQPGGTYWNVFDEKGKGEFSITLAGWENAGEVRRLVYDAAGVVLRADSLEELAAAMSVPASSLKATVSRYNELAAQGLDLDFKAFTEKTFPKPKPIDAPPFYAAQFFPITRKSMGGVDVDGECRVLTPLRQADSGPLRCWRGDRLRRYQRKSCAGRHVPGSGDLYGAHRGTQHRAARRATTGLRTWHGSGE